RPGVPPARRKRPWGADHRIPRSLRRRDLHPRREAPVLHQRQEGDGEVSEPPMTDFDAKRALLLARAAAATYRGSGEEIASSLGALSVKGFANRGTCGLTSRHGPDVVIAFRGTAPGEVWNWLTSLDVTLSRGATGRTHQGMTQAIDLVWPEVQAQL